MRTIRLIIQYDGTDYCGWQRQPGLPTVQDRVELALAQIVGERVLVQAAGRTDAGVHAVAMPAAFKTESAAPLRAFVNGVNSHLPDNIAVLSAEEVTANFKVIGDAVSKTYRYRIFNNPIRSPLHHRISWHVWSQLDLASMRTAADYFIGSHDFSSFRGQGCTAATTVRRIDTVKIHREADLITIDVTGSGFLKNMVRIMVGTLVDVGRGRFTPAHIKTLLEKPDRKKAGVTAPPQGLCLLKVFY